MKAKILVALTTSKGPGTGFSRNWDPTLRLAHATTSACDSVPRFILFAKF